MTKSTLIHATGRVLAAIDPSAYAPSVADHAAWAASRLEAPLDLIHVIDRKHGAAGGTDLSGSLALGDQDALLQELATLDERRGRLAQEQGRLLLERERSRIAADAGVQVQVKQRHGTLVEALLDLEPEARLFVIGKRGEHADFASGHLGSNLERVMRAVHRPVLIASRAFKPVQRFLIAFDGSATTRKCVEMVCASPLLKGLACDVLMAGEASAERRTHMQWAIDRLGTAGFAPQPHHVEGAAETAIAASVGNLGIDLLVMGAYGHSRIRTLIVGSTTTQVLRSCPIPVLLLR
jgi:nucleotide-binding universal stress UspA family protein